MAAAERAPPTPPQKKKDANSRAGGVGKGRPTFASSTLDHQSHAESQGNRTGHAFATSMRAHPNRGKFLEFCFLSICTVAWLCSHACPGKHWPTCFDQTCGYPGEGPLTTLDSPEAPEPSLTPTQELRTCCMVRRKVCRACESSLAPKCQTWACSAECEASSCERAVLPTDGCLCRLGALKVFTPRGLVAARRQECPVSRRTRGRRSTSRLPRSKTRRGTGRASGLAGCTAAGAGRARAANAD